MTGDVNLIHARAAAKILRNLGYETTADGLTTEARRAEAVIQAARAFYDAPCGTTPAVEGTPCGDLVLAIGDALAALGDGQ